MFMSYNQAQRLNVGTVVLVSGASHLEETPYYIATKDQLVSDGYYSLITCNGRNIPLPLIREASNKERLETYRYLYSLGFSAVELSSLMNSWN